MDKKRIISGTIPPDDSSSNCKIIPLSNLSIKIPGTKKALKHKCFKASCGGDKRDRTADLLNAIQALSQLSYTPKLAASQSARIIIAKLIGNVKHEIVKKPSFT